MNSQTERWRRFNALEQMGNIGSDVNRTFLWRKKGNEKLSQQAMESALELFDLTLADPRWTKTKGRLKEIARAREAFCGLIFGDNEYNESESSLMKYFDEFALAARKDK